MCETVRNPKMADESLEESSALDISKLKVPDLKKELKNRGLSTTGNKNDLVERLQAAIRSPTNPELIDEIEEDLLNEEDDDEHLDERDSIINELDNNLDDSPKAQKRKLDGTDKSHIDGPPKKVILKRNNSDTLTSKAVTANEKNNEVQEDTTPNGQQIEDKKVIKFSELSAKERLEMRAKKFGVTALSDDAKKIVRAERFGANPTDFSASSIKSGNKEADVDVLKQRAARFGVSVSSVMSDLEKQEKMEKRKQRFGVITATSNNTIKDSEAAKIARLERFKTSVK
ncbi:SAP domain-containing ribonucleoprotein [Sitophilus oryzae]|uniref:SAP domain-containing ribonucleoprotein n=1 Tax=Sitophilus oryzae TaxID=7048 RepID=A0A6J2YYR2_SITOR|nr:SAP domain-containing ribonucleoprotein [Sitophilus oryzae]